MNGYISDEGPAWAAGPISAASERGRGGGVLVVRGMVGEARRGKVKAAAVAVEDKEFALANTLGEEIRPPWQKMVFSRKGVATLRGMSCLRDVTLRTMWIRVGATVVAWLGVASCSWAERTFLLVRGADGEEAYGEKFAAQVKAWQQALAHSDVTCVVIGESAGDAGKADAVLLQEQLAALRKEGPDDLWVVLIGHGTWDGAEARLNLRGPDVSATELAAWLEPFQRPIVVFNTTSCSGPFLAKLSKRGRVVVTATRGGNEKNYARFGEELAVALSDPAMDADQDGQLSVLELAVGAAQRTAAFYQEAGRLATEHALIDDTGDGQGTPLAWFRGLRAIKKGQGETDGFRARQQILRPSAAIAALTEEQREACIELEEKIAVLREKKASLPEEDYFQQLETLLLQLADAKGIGPP